MHVALGLKARTGRAIVVAMGSDRDGPRVIERTQMPLLPAGEFAPYHAAAGLAPAAARAHVERSIARARQLATEGIRDAFRRCVAAGHDLRGCGVLVGAGMPDWSTEAILAVHVRMHQAEGELFRDMLVAGARACGLELTTLPEKSAIAAAAKLLRLSDAALASRLAALGKAAGPPWGKDQKEAAAAALAALQRGAR